MNCDRRWLRSPACGLDPGRPGRRRAVADVHALPSTTGQLVVDKKARQQAETAGTSHATSETSDHTQPQGPMSPGRPVAIDYIR